MNRTLLVAVLAVSCSHTRPSEMTAEEHRAEARQHEDNARQEKEQYRPELTSRAPGPRAAFEGPSSPDREETYNPTAGHLAAADREMRRAAEHLAAARKLETFESAACREIPAPERSACPLLASSVTEVRTTRTGLELQLKASVDWADTYRRLSCHLAYAEAEGFERPSCPLFVRGMSIELRGGGVLVFSGSTPEIARQLQEQARRIFAPQPAAPEAVSVTP